MSLSSNDSLREVSGLSPSEWHLLADDRRRLTIALLADRTNPMSLEDLAKEIATNEHGTLPNGAGIEQVSTSLHHIHLPKLDEAGVLTYDPDTHRIVPPEASS